MKANLIKYSLTLLLAFGFVSISFAQRQTGVIAGRIIEKEGKPLPGATVTISGPAMMGINNYVTLNTGFFRFPSVFPGEYELRAEMPGFKTAVRKGLIVSVGKTIELSIELEAAAVEEEVTAIAVSPVVDVEASKVSVNYTAPFLARLPLNRDLYDIQNSLPGAISEGVEYRRTSSILGGTVRSQLYALDGVPMNDLATFYSMANINVDVYEEIEFEVGAHPAEVGQTDSTYINIVSKSGGNTMSGGATFYYLGKDFSSNLISAEQIKAFQVDPPEKLTDSKDISANIGGPIMQDRAWFFLNGRRYAWDKAMPGNPEIRMAKLGFANSPHYDYKHEEWMGFAKLTVQATKNIKYMGMFHYNHVYEPVYQNSGGGDTAFEQTDKWDHENIYTTTHQVNYILDQNTFVDFRGTYINRRFPIISQTQDQPTFFDYKQDIWWGASAYNDESVHKKMLASVSLTRFQDDFLNASHEFKAGVEFEQSEYHRDWYRGNPYYLYYDDYAAGSPYYYSPSLRQGRLRISYSPPAAGYWDVQDNVRRISGFLEDSATAGRLAVNIGLRLDYSFQYEPDQSRPKLRYSYGPPLLNPAITDSNALLEALIGQWQSEIGPTSPFDSLTTPYKKVVDFFTLSPRIGVVYDVFGNGKTAIKVSYSRYYEPIWAAKYNAGQIFSPGSVNYYWNDLNSNKLLDLPPEDSYVLESYPNQDPDYTYYVKDLKAPYLDEILAGIEQEVVPDFRMGLQFVRKQNKNIIEDTDANNGCDPSAKDDKGPIWIPFSFTDPGWDGQWGTSDDQRLTVYGLRADRPVPTWKGLNPPEAKRKYWAAIMTFDKRMSHKWQLKASILYSSFKGNSEATFGPTEGKSTAFNDPNTLINAYGPLWFDRPLQIKIMGTYFLPYDIIISAYFQHFSGAPWGRTISRVYFPEDFPAVQETYVGVNAEVPGARRREPFTNLDLRIEKSFVFGGHGRLNFYVDIFNLAGHSGVNINEDPAPRLRFDNDPPVYQLSSTYAMVTSVYGVRSFRLGVRWSF